MILKVVVKMKKFQLESNSILVIPSKLKLHILKEFSKLDLCNIKVITLTEMSKKFYFDYDDRAIYYLMKKYHYQYDVAKMYLSRCYEVDKNHFGSSKIKKIMDLKEELKKEKLLIFHPSFRKYLAHKKIILYGYEYCNGLDLKLIKDLKKNYEVIEYKEEKKEYVPNGIYQFDTIEQEVVFIAEQINQLVLQEKIPFHQIKLCGANGEYIGLIKRIFEWHHIPISFQDNYLYATKIGQDFLNHLTDDPKDSLKYIEENYLLSNPKVLDIYNQIVQILNRYTWANSLIEIKSFLIDAFQKEKIGVQHYQEEIEVIDSLAEIEEGQFAFLLGFNQGEIPKTYKDESYFNDTLNQLLGLDTTNERNQKSYQKWLKEIQNTKNLTITCKKTSSLGVHYLSSLNDELKLEVQKGEIGYQYSHLLNQLTLAEKIDTYIKYNEKEEGLELLYNNYPNLPYGTFCSDYQQIDQNKLKNYINHQLVLSYSSMNSYYQCSFRYYLSNILNLNLFEETFYTILGNLFHYILSLVFQKEIDIKEEYQDYIKKCNYSFNSRETFFLNQLEKELEFIIKTIKKQNETNSLKKMFFEEKITVSKNRKDMDVTFKGFIDKLMMNDDENILAIVDYKTGNPDLNLNHIIHGLDLQLPVYVYLARKKFPNTTIAGFYLQKILNNEISKDYKHTYEYLKEEKLKLQGYSNSDLSILEQIDSSYYDSKVIKGMRTTSKGIASKKVLTSEQINRLETITEDKIEEAITGILNAQFEINPKRVGMDNLGCKYCSFQDICFSSEKNIKNLKEYQNMEFLGGEEYDTNQTC